MNTTSASKKKNAAPTTQRSLAAIAAEIRKEWPKPYFGAVPYLQAMGHLETVKDAYGMDDGDMIVRYFLSNATTWKGDAARRIKAELKALLW